MASVVENTNTRTFYYVDGEHNDKLIRVGDIVSVRNPNFRGRKFRVMEIGVTGTSRIKIADRIRIGGRGGGRNGRGAPRPTYRIYPELVSARNLIYENVGFGSSEEPDRDPSDNTVPIRVPLTLDAEDNSTDEDEEKEEEAPTTPTREGQSEVERNEDIYDRIVRQRLRRPQIRRQNAQRLDSSSSDENNEVSRRLDFAPVRLQVGKTYTREQIKDSNGADIPMNIERSKYMGCVGSYKCTITAFPLMKAVQCKPCDHVFSYVGLKQWLKKKKINYAYTNNLCPLCNQEINEVYVMKDEDLTEFMREESIAKIDEELTNLKINCRDYKKKKEELEAEKRKLEFQKLFKERKAARKVQENTNSQLKF